MKKLAIVYGLGGGWLDSPSGDRYLLARAKAVGLVVPDSPFDYTDNQGIYNFLKDATWRGCAGDSFGATFPPSYFAQFDYDIDYFAGFQPSIHASVVRSDDTILIPTQVKYCHCVRDPDWTDTAGLGYAKYVVADRAKTTLVETDHRGAHPDNYGPMQDLIFAEIKMKAGV